MRGIVLLILSFVCLGACRQYSATPLTVNPVLLLGPSPTGTSTNTGISAIKRNATGGVVFTVAAHNSELTFQGYSLYEAASESAVMDLPASAGTKCGSFLSGYPIASIQYTMEASTHPQSDSAYLLCVFPVDLTTGNYASIRARYIVGPGQPEITSMPSNALVVP